MNILIASFTPILPQFYIYINCFHCAHFLHLIYFVSILLNFTGPFRVSHRILFIFLSFSFLSISYEYRTRTHIMCCLTTIVFVPYILLLICTFSLNLSAPKNSRPFPVVLALHNNIRFASQKCNNGSYVLTNYIFRFISIVQ